NQVGLVFIGILAAQSVLSFFRTVFFAVVSEKAMADARKKAYAKLIGQHVEFFEKRRVGELISRLTSDVAQMQNVISVSLAEFLRQIITVIGVTAFLMWRTPGLTWIMLAVLPVSVLIAVGFGRYIKKFSKKRQDKLATSNTIVDETLQSFSVVKSFSNEKYELDRYGNSLNDVVKISLEFARVRGLFFMVLIGVLTGSIFFILWQGAKMVQQGQLPAGDLLSFVLYSGLLAGAFASLSSFYATLSSAVGATERVMDIMNSTPEITAQNLSDKVNPLAFKGDIQFKQVTFEYPTRDDVPVLKGINLQVRSGEKIALVGSSGAGKSTIASLLLRFYPDYGGEISIDGQDIHDFDLTAYRQNFGIVPQEIILFGGTIRENIGYGKPNSTEAEIIEAARKANAYDFISKFPEGLDTVVGERGIKLSGGQRQRVAIARAILRDPKILILDEATSALDAESESLVQEALSRLMEGRTSIIIAHRLSTIRDVDRIYVLD
ncbi:UNVERIFIED_CONTAM: hypothetical protein GTU68_010139, partial [Idotea baltica]|nr:hypothetical protein [Idotea baltica]